MSVAAQTLRPPSRTLMFLEGRAIHELGAFLGALPLLSLAPRGDGHPVLVLPGLIASDMSTRPLRDFLKSKGYAVSGWRQGRNLGLRSGVQDGMVDLLQEMNETSGRKVSLIGWSLGGVFVREMARYQPALVRQVFTLGSPFSGDPNANNLVKIFALMNPKQAKNPDMEGFRRRCVAPPVHCVAIHTKSDGIVAWQCSLEQESATTENVEVRGSHFGLTLNSEVFRAIAERLPLKR